jgi:hypothetical protein
MRTGTAAPPSGGGFSPSAPFVQPGPPKARRQPALVALGVALIGLSAAGFVFWNHQQQTQSDPKSSVLVLTRDVPTGQKLVGADLATVQMTVPVGVKAISSSSASIVLQDVATTQLHAGAVLTQGDIGATPPIPPGTDVIAVTLKPDVTPAGLAPGRNVLLVANRTWPLAIISTGNTGDVKLPPDSLWPANPPTYKATVVSILGNKVTFSVQPGDAVVVSEFANDPGRLGIILLPSGS